MEAEEFNIMIKTKPEEFLEFNKLLMENAPKGYIPWYFPVIKNNKAPDGLAIAKRSPKVYEGKAGNWKAEWSRLTFDEAYQRLKKGYNVGISARANDELVIIDIDNWKLRKYMPKTLITKSRKRCGFHCFCWKKGNEIKVNIPTDNNGEVRSCDQYVVAAGSYCETSNKEIDKEDLTNELKDIIKNDKNLGCYTVHNKINPISLSFDELPYFFKERKLEEKQKPKMLSKPINYSKHKSALYNLSISDIISISPGTREPHPLHSSDTGMNFSISGELAHCWRHLVSLNAIQFLVVKSGYMSCDKAGTSHKGGISFMTGDEGAIFYAWLEAKKCNLIPKEDRVPIKAMKYIAKKHKLIDKDFESDLPNYVYNRVLKIIKEEY